MNTSKAINVVPAPLPLLNTALLGVCALLAAAVGCGDGAALPSRPASASAANDTDAAEGQGKLLARVDLLEQGSIEFYQPEPGIISIQESGAIASARVRDPSENSMSAAELYEHLSGEPASPELIAADQQLEGETEGSEGLGSVTVSAPIRAVSQDKSYPDGAVEYQDSFRASYCVPTDRNYLWTDVLGDSSVATSGTNFFNSGVYANVGAVQYRSNAYGGTFRQIQALDGDYGEWHNIAPGHYRYIRVHCKNCYVEVKVSDPNASVYDFCTNFHY